MNEVNRIQLEVDQATAAALRDDRRREAVGRLVERMVRPSDGEDPLAGVLDATASAARAGGLTDEEIAAELALYNAEHRG